MSDSALELNGRPTPVAELLHTLANEMSDLGHRTETMQHLVSPLISGEAAEALHGLQELDLIAQRLFAVARFLTHLEADAGWAVDTHLAGQSVPLADLARRLTRSSETHAATDTAGGELLLFD